MNMRPGSNNLSDTRQGILLVVTGLSIASISGRLMKLLAADMSAIQIAWFRFAGYALLMLPIVYIRCGRSLFKPVRPGIQMIRGISLGMATVAFITGAKTVDFADAIAILYAYPFLLMLIAVLFLGEKVQLSGWLGIGGGFLGVLLVMRPEFNLINAGTFAVFICAIIVSVQMALNRKLGSISHPLVTSLWGAFISTIFLSSLLPFFWQPVPIEHWWLLALLVISGALNQTLVVFAFSKASASTLAPFTYFEIVAAVFVGYFMFGTLPGWVSWLGIFFITISGVIVARSLSGRHTPRRNPKI